MKTKAIYSGILSIMLFMSFFSDARGRRGRIIETEAQYREALRESETLRKSSREYIELIEQIRQYEADNPGLSNSRIPIENNTANDVLNYQGDGKFSLRDSRPQFSMSVNKLTGVSAREKAETIEVLSEMTSLSKEQIKEILESRNDETVDQIRQLAIHVKANRESVDPQTINTLAELAYTMRNRIRETSAQQNYTPSVNVMLSLVRNIASMASTWAATPRANALKLITTFNKQYRELKEAGIKSGKGLVASALNRALDIAEGIKALRERNARKREIDILCRQ